MNLYGKLAKFTFSFQNRLLEFDFLMERSVDKKRKKCFKKY